MDTHTNRQRYLCLRAEFRASFPWKSLTRDGFRDWARKERVPPINVPAQAWRPMREGKPVRAATIEAFSEYIGDVRGILTRAECTLAAIATAGRPEAAAKGGGRQKLAWTLGWKDLYADILSAFTLDDESFCADEADLSAAARIVYEGLGWDDRRLTGASAIAYAQGVIQRSPDEYAEALKLCWRANEHAVLFPTQRIGGSTRRIGVNVAVPVTEAFYRRFRAGEEEEVVRTPDHFLPRSQYIYYLAIAQDVGIDMKRDKAARSMNHMRNIVYQLAALSEPAERQDRGLHIVGMAGSKENVARQRAYGFKPTGAKLATGEDIVEIGPPSGEQPRDAYLASLIGYTSMRTIIGIYQAFIEAERRQVE